MNKAQDGFTLIELVIVIVILGILAVTAIPAYRDLKDEAAQAAVDGVAGALAAGAAVNKAAKEAGDTSAVSVASCLDVNQTLANPLPQTPVGDSYVIDSDTGGFPNCKVTGPAPQSKVATFKAIAA